MPLLTVTVCAVCVQEAEIVRALRAVLEGMGRPRQQCLRFLMGLLLDVTEQSATNRMGPSNLAVCWTPTLVFTQVVRGAEMKF